MDQPNAPARDHVQRPDLPWRDGQRTECGKPTNDVRSVISRAQLQQRIKTDGITRAAYITCVTCLQTASRWKDWAGDPLDVLGREFYGGNRDPRLGPELLALAALVEAHRDEFDGYLTGLGQTVSLAAARVAKKKAGLRVVR